MHTTLLFAALLLLTSGTNTMAETTCDPDGTQFEKNLCAVLDAKAADAEVQALYARLRTARADDRDFIAALEGAQRAWLSYRDAEIAAAFPCEHEDKTICHGASTPLHVARLEEELSRERIERLQRYIDGAWSGPAYY